VKDNDGRTILHCQKYSDELVKEQLDKNSVNISEVKDKYGRTIPQHHKFIDETKQMEK
jgi:hypothetical protein